MNSARRSERLRRKRQSTPGLSQPGAYSLYGNGYIVESEISLAPSSSQNVGRAPSSSNVGKLEESRRMRYKDSPHRFVSEESLAAAEDEGVVDEPDGEGDKVVLTPETQKRTSNIVDQVRVSLFDILGSAARRPVNTRWRTTADEASRKRREGAMPRPRDWDDEAVVEDRQEGEQEHEEVVPNRSRAKGGGAGRVRPRLVFGGSKGIAPIVALAVMFVCAMSVLLLLDERVTTRRGDGRTSAWVSLRQQCVRASERLAAAWVYRFDGARGNVLGRVASTLSRAMKAILRVLFRNAWSDSSGMRGDYVSRKELESVILPSLMSEARRTAAEEAARISRDVNVGQGRGAREDFASFSERYAADKGLPTDYALQSFGAVVWESSPSVAQMLVGFARRYGQALLSGEGEGVRFTPTWPKRPITALQPDVLPGNCWSFPGSEGSITIRLARAVRPTMITVEHTPKGSVRSIGSALRNFRVLGVPLNASRAAAAEGALVNLGEFEFDVSGNRRHLQSFVIGTGDEVEEIRAVKVEILSNHGAQHTCVYRLRVHGIEVSETEEGTGADAEAGRSEGRELL